MSQEHDCARCARLGKTCCQQTEIYVTMNDVKRIAASASRLDFFEYRQVSDPAYTPADDDPPWQLHVFRPDGSRRVLRQLPSGDCIFLSSSGCTLSLEIRPLICRLYPLTYTAAGILPEPDERCPATRHNQDSVAERFGMSMQLALHWHSLLYNEMAQPAGGGTDEDWTDLRPAV